MTEQIQYFKWYYAETQINFFIWFIFFIFYLLLKKFFKKNLKCLILMKEEEGGEVVIVAATHPTPPVSNSGGTQGQGMPFFAHKGKKEIHPYLNILIYKCLAIRPRGTKIK